MAEGLHCLVLGQEQAQHAQRLKPRQCEQGGLGRCLWYYCAQLRAWSPFNKCVLAELLITEHVVSEP